MNDSEPCTSRIMALNSRPANSPCFDGGGGGGGGEIWDDDDDNAGLWLYLGSVQRKNRNMKCFISLVSFVQINCCSI